MKKRFLALIIIFLAVFSIPNFVQAQTSTCMTDCLNNGNTFAECNAGCNGTFIPPDPAFNPLEGPTAETFDSLNPLKIAGSQQADALSTPGGIISRILVFAFPLAGLILFVMLTWGGAEILLGATNKQLVEAGKKRLTAAMIGFGLLFASYWIARVLEEILGVVILG